VPLTGSCRLGDAHVGEQEGRTDEPTRGPVVVPEIDARDGRHTFLLTSYYESRLAAVDRP